MHPRARKARTRENVLRAPLPASAQIWYLGHARNQALLYIMGGIMAWRVARSLDKLLAEINAKAPNRSKRSDGSIGDAAHQGGGSDHNPNWANVVCARDFTHDPGNGADMGPISEHIRKSHPKAAKYVIFNRRIAGIHTGWAWRSYSGANPHNHHMHVSVGRGPDGASTGPYDDTSSWGIASAGGATDDMSGIIGLKKGDKGDRVEYLQAVLGYAGFPVEVDSVYGAATASALLKMRKAMGSSVTSANSVTGYAAAQLQKALAIKMAKEHGKPGPKGDPGKAGKDGADGKDGKDGSAILPAGTTFTATTK